MDEYFLFNFQDHTHKIRDSYVTLYNRLAFYEKLNDFRYEEAFINKFSSVRSITDFPNEISFF